MGAGTAWALLQVCQHSLRVHLNRQRTGHVLLEEEWRPRQIYGICHADSVVLAWPNGAHDGSWPVVALHEGLVA